MSITIALIVIYLLIIYWCQKDLDNQKREVEEMEKILRESIKLKKEICE